VEGITEFLPISSTGHLILTSHFLNLSQTEFIKTFEIAIQLGAIGSVIFLYGKSLLVNKEIIKRVLFAFLPTAILGFLFYKLIKKFLMGNIQVVLWAMLLGGIVLIIFDLCHREKNESTDDLSRLSYPKAFLIGIFQSLAMIPGVSRSAATIIGGLALGMKRKTIVEFSFLLAIPTMLAATGLDILKTGLTFSPDQCLFLLVGFGTSFVVALLSIKFLLHFIQHHNFIVFGIYRVALSLTWFFWG
jgi:undecaprenyl-diphosphatase